jgi:hypothetical protein
MIICINNIAYIQYLKRRVHINVYWDKFKGDISFTISDEAKGLKSSNLNKPL